MVSSSMPLTDFLQDRLPVTAPGTGRLAAEAEVVGLDRPRKGLQADQGMCYGN